MIECAGISCCLHCTRILQLCHVCRRVQTCADSVTLGPGGTRLCFLQASTSRSHQAQLNVCTSIECPNLQNSCDHMPASPSHGTHQSDPQTKCICCKPEIFRSSPKTKFSMSVQATAAQIITTHTMHDMSFINCSRKKQHDNLASHSLNVAS